MQAQPSLPETPVPLPVDRFLIAIAAGAVALIVVGIIVAALGIGRGQTVTLDPRTPDGAVQSYVEALRAGDLERAYGLLSQVG
jgi:hypothetical protein